MPDYILQQAIDELEGDEMDQIQACEKAYLAALKAIDIYILKKNGTKIRAGEPEAHSQRADVLEFMMLKGIENATDLFRLFNEIKSVFHGGCFYRTKAPSEQIKEIYFEQIIPEILEKSGCL